MARSGRQRPQVDAGRPALRRGGHGLGVDRRPEPERLEDGGRLRGIEGQVLAAEGGQRPAGLQARPRQATGRAAGHDQAAAVRDRPEQAQQDVDGLVVLEPVGVVDDDGRGREPAELAGQRGHGDGPRRGAGFGDGLDDRSARRAGPGRWRRRCPGPGWPGRCRAASIDSQARGRSADRPYSAATVDLPYPAGPMRASIGCGASARRRTSPRPADDAAADPRRHELGGEDAQASGDVRLTWASTAGERPSSSLTVTRPPGDGLRKSPVLGIPRPSPTVAGDPWLGQPTTRRAVLSRVSPTRDDVTRPPGMDHACRWQSERQDVTRVG